MILTSALSQLPSDVDDTRTRSLSPSSASDLIQRTAFQQGFSSPIITAAPSSFIHPHPVVLDYPSRLPRPATRPSGDMHDAPVPVAPFPAELDHLQSLARTEAAPSYSLPPGWVRWGAAPRVSRPLEDGPQPPSLRTQLSRKKKDVSSRKSCLKDSADAEFDKNNSGGEVGQSSESAPPIDKTETPITLRSQPPGLLGNPQTLATSSDKSLIVSRGL